MNGIGKSTAVRVIAGVLKPNFGDWNATKQIMTVNLFFKGTEAQGFLKIKRRNKVTQASASGINSKSTRQSD